MASFTVVRIAHKIPGNSSSQVPLAPSIFFLIPAKMILLADSTWPFVCGLDTKLNLIWIWNVSQYSTVFLLMNLECVNYDGFRDAKSYNYVAPNKLTYLLVSDGTKSYNLRPQLWTSSGPLHGERVSVGLTPIFQKGAQPRWWNDNLKASLELQQKTGTFDKIKLKTQHLLSELANSIHFLWPCWWLFWNLGGCHILPHGFLKEYNYHLQESHTLAEGEWMTFCRGCLHGTRTTWLF